MGKREQLIDDIHGHLAEQLRRLIGDTADTCARARLPIEAVLQIMVSALLFEAAFAGRTMGLSQHEFIRVCNNAFKLLEEQYGEGNGQETLQ
jgi:hypothetical protein